MHVMLDLETMATSSHAAIVAIGAVLFEPDTGAMSSNFYRIVDLEDAAKFGHIKRAECDFKRFSMIAFGWCCL